MSAEPVWPVVYICGPINRGCKPCNIRRGIAAGLWFLRRQVSPIIPMLNAIPEAGFPVAMPGDSQYENVMRADFALVLRADALLRLPGPSAGGDREEALARAAGIRIFRSREKCLAYLRAQAGPAAEVGKVGPAGGLTPTGRIYRVWKSTSSTA